MPRTDVVGGASSAAFAADVSRCDARCRDAPGSAGRGPQTDSFIIPGPRGARSDDYRSAARPYGNPQGAARRQVQRRDEGARTHGAAGGGVGKEVDDCGNSACARPHRYRRRRRQGCCVNSDRGERDPRRLVVCVNQMGRSTINMDAPASPSITRPNGNIVHDLWQQVSVPARCDEGTTHVDVGEPPIGGAVVRMLTLPPNTTGERPPVALHITPALFVITVIEGRVLVALDDGECELEAGDTIVIPGSSHDVGNLSAAPARMVFTTFALAEHGSSRAAAPGTPAA
jgi:quercetin dioxygenase-like cupin family protein